MSRPKIEDVYKKYPNKRWDWYYLSGNPTISENFFEKHIKHVKWGSLSRNKGVSVSFFERHLDKVDWAGLSCNKNLSVEFFEKHLDKVDWELLSGNESLSAEFFERHLEKVEWMGLSCNKNLSVEFFEKHLDKVDWELLSGNESLSAEFFERHLDKVVWRNIEGNKKLPESFFAKHVEKMRKHVLSFNTALSQNFFEQHFEEIVTMFGGGISVTDEYCEKCVRFDPLFFRYFQGGPNISVEFYNKYTKRINWAKVAENPHVSEDVFVGRLDKIYTLCPIHMDGEYVACDRGSVITLGSIAAKKNASPEFLDYLTFWAKKNVLGENFKIFMEFLSQNPNLTNEMIEKYKDDLVFGNLSKNTFVSERWRKIEIGMVRDLTKSSACILHIVPRDIVNEVVKFL
jgi:hypothetical protein